MICDKCKKEMNPGQVRERRQSFGPDPTPEVYAFIDSKSQQKIVEEIEATKPKLTDFEQNFLDSVFNQDGMSEKQRTILAKIVTKYLMKQDSGARKRPTRTESSPQREDKSEEMF